MFARCPPPLLAICSDSSTQRRGVRGESPVPLQRDEASSHIDRNIEGRAEGLFKSLRFLCASALKTLLITSSCISSELFYLLHTGNTSIKFVIFPLS